jgi:hypothetical protein
MPCLASKRLLVARITLREIVVNGLCGNAQLRICFRLEYLVAGPGAVHRHSRFTLAVAVILGSVIAVPGSTEGRLPKLFRGATCLTSYSTTVVI